MRWVSHIARLVQIQWVLRKHQVTLLPWYWTKNKTPAGKSLRLALEALGPLFVKFGQLLSTRQDLLPEDIALELAKLQDNVPPFSPILAREIIEESLGGPIESFFNDFEETPLASASVAQVHKAKLKDNTAVIIKVLRPGIHQQVARDVALLETLSYLGEQLIPRVRPLRLREVVQEFKTILSDELDLRKEAANASQLRRNFVNSESLYVPQIYWEYARKNCLVMEQIQGIPISDITKLKELNVDLKRLAERGVEIFFTQVFRDCFFHADMHPGNIFVSPSNPHNPQYIAVDFGIMGMLSPEDQRYLGENFLAFFKRDYRRVAQLHVESGWVPAHTRIEAFESAIRTVCEPIFERPLKDISIGLTLTRLFQTARQFDMQVQPQLVLLQKTLLSIEGLGRQLYPELDLWNTAKPFLERWMKKQFGPRAFYETIKTKFPIWTDKLPELPEALVDIARYWQEESQLLRRVIEKKAAPNEIRKLRKHRMQKALGITLVALGGVLALTSADLQIVWNTLREYQLVLIALSIGAGLFLIARGARPEKMN